MIALRGKLERIVTSCGGARPDTISASTATNITDGTVDDAAPVAIASTVDVAAPVVIASTVDVDAPVASAPSSNSVQLTSTATTTATTTTPTTRSTLEIGEWVWTGEWAFGAVVVSEDTAASSGAALPFRYTWIMTCETEKLSAKKRQDVTANNTSDFQKETGGSAAEKSQEQNNVAVSVNLEASLKASLDENETISTAESKGETKPGERSAVVDIGEVEEPLKILVASDRTSDIPIEMGKGKEPATLPASKTIDFHGCTLPASGQWTGSFDTLRGRKGHQKHTPVPEHFYLQWNLTPDDTVRTVFANNDDIGRTTDADKLPPNHIHVTGNGENQYGYFELVGSFDPATSTLQCQKRYVMECSDEMLSLQQQQQRKSQYFHQQQSVFENGRPHKTRKRQLSWKRRAAYDSGDDSGEPKNKQPQSRKRVRADSTATALSDGMTTAAVAPNNALTVTIPGSVTTSFDPPPFSGKRLPASSPKTKQAAVSGAAMKRVAVTAVVEEASTLANRNVATTAHPNHQPGQMKLPAAGDPPKARWRAANFLYYYRDDPAVAAEGISNISNGGISTVTNGSSQVAHPKYVIYEGEMLHSHRHGRGVCLYNNGMLYEGDWRRDKEHGRGTLMTADRKRIIYKGDWERGRMHGTGIYYYGDGKVQQQQDGGGSRYEGEFKENLRHGSGTYVLPDGSVYSGQWREGLMCGRGDLTWPDGSVYVGDWKDGKRHGIGLLKTSDGFVYDGGWVHNSMEGRGSATYPNGQQYNGLFSRGRREGRGTVLFTNGAVYEGRFRDDAIDGQGTMKMSRTMVVPRSNNTLDKNNDENGKRNENATTAKDDFMIPVSFQSDMGHIHRKAGFTHGGK